MGFPNRIMYSSFEKLAISLKSLITLSFRDYINYLFSTLSSNAIKRGNNSSIGSSSIYLLE